MEAMAKDNIQVALGQVLLPLIEEITPKIKPMADAVVGFIEGIPGALEKIESGSRGSRITGRGSR